MPARFPPPWTARDTGSSFEVRDGAGFPILWVCYDHRARGGDTAGERLNRDQARRIAGAITRLPDLLGSAQQADKAVSASSTRPEPSTWRP